MISNTDISQNDQNDLKEIQRGGKTRSRSNNAYNNAEILEN